MRDDFKDSTDGVAGAQHLVDFSFHALFGFGIGTVQQNFLLIP